MGPRPVLIAVALLALGFGVGFYVQGHGGSSRDHGEAAAPAPSAPATTGAPAPAPPTPPPAAKPPPRRRFGIAQLSPSQRSQIRARGFWHRGCPVPLSGLRELTVSYRGFDGQLHTGALVVNGSAASPLERAFRTLLRQRVPIRHIGFADFYGPRSVHPADGDVTGAFECRQAVPSPCTGGLKSGHWSMHAYGLAVDLNPTENPYIGCGESRDPATKPFRDRTRHRRGMVDARVIDAFRSVGWGWGGSWTGSTKDYMHFSATGH